MNGNRKNDKLQQIEELVVMNQEEIVYFAQPKAVI